MSEALCRRKHSAMSLSLSIGRAKVEAATEALELVFRDVVPELRPYYVQTIAAAIQDGSVPSDGLLEARRGGRLVGALWCHMQAGRTALLRPPRVVEYEPAETALLLLEAANSYLSAEGAKVAQAILEHESLMDEALLGAVGYRRGAKLDYLMSETRDFPRERPAQSLAFQPYCAANHRRLVHVVEATYEGTLDCPLLNGVRDIEEVLTSYRATGVFDPARWLIVQHGAEDVGCLLLTDHPETETWELVYMGLRVSARGRGWGTQLVRYAQWLAFMAGRPRVMAAVDAANGPAVRAYRASGFRKCDERTVFLRVFAS